MFLINKERLKYAIGTSNIMELEDYLREIADSKDADLTQEWGVYDNYGIYFLDDAEEIADILEASGDFEIRPGPNGKFNESSYSDDYIFLSYLKGNVDIVVSNYDNKKPSVKEGFRRYNGKIGVHVGSRDVQSTHWLRDFANCIDDISLVVIEQEVPSIYYSSLGWKFLGESEAVKDEKRAYHLL